MNLQQYREMISKKLLNDAHKVVSITNEMRGGSRPSHHTYEYDDDDDDSDSDYEVIHKGVLHRLRQSAMHHQRNREETDLPKIQVEQELVGGKSFFKSKAFKNVTRGISHVAKDVGHEVLKQGVKKLGNYALDALEQEGPMLAEEAPMLAMGAGMRKKRVVSAKMKRRHAIIKKLMKEHGLTMTEANSYITKHNIKY